MILLALKQWLDNHGFIVNQTWRGGLGDERLRIRSTKSYTIYLSYDDGNILLYTVDFPKTPPGGRPMRGQARKKQRGLTAHHRASLSALDRRSQRLRSVSTTIALADPEFFEKLRSTLITIKAKRNE